MYSVLCYAIKPMDVLQFVVLCIKKAYPACLNSNEFDASPLIFPVEPLGLQVKLHQSPYAQDKSFDLGFRACCPHHVQFNSIYSAVLQVEHDPLGFTHTQIPKHT